MTVCIAALFHWNYGTPQNPDWSPIAVTATDRMITTGDVQYEPQQTKVGSISPRAIVLIAGDYTLHSQAIRDTQRQVSGSTTMSPLAVATIYGRAVQTIKQKQAEDLFLAPLGLNADSFLAQQKEMTSEFVESIKAQMQGYHGDELEALAVVSDGKDVHLYYVDFKGTVSNFDDVGFAAIGMGGSHARSSLMQAGYVNAFALPDALVAVHRAKKRAEIAPGVGRHTDMQLVFRDSIEPLRRDVFQALEVVHEDYEDARRNLEVGSVDRLREMMGGRPSSDANEPDGERARVAREDAEAYGSDAGEVAEAPRPDEGGEQTISSDGQGGRPN